VPNVEQEVNQGETEAGAVSAAVSPSNQKVSITNIPLGPYGSGVIARRIYRTPAGGGPFKLVTTLTDNVTTAYTDSVADGSLGSYVYQINTTGQTFYDNCGCLGYNQTNGTFNTFNGYNAGQYASEDSTISNSGMYETGFGADVMYNNVVTGPYNTGVGYEALSDLTSGNSNTAVGYESLQQNSSGTNNTALGYGDLQDNTVGGENTAVGAGTMESVTGYYNTSVGYGALNLYTGSYNTAVGGMALNSATGTGDTAVGYNALNPDTAGENTAVGYEALATNTTGIGNTAMGYEALENQPAGGNSGSNYNTAVGSFALQLNTSGYYNVAVGSNALQDNLSGWDDTAVGLNALVANTANDNTAVGNQALTDNTSGVYNTAMGSAALFNNTLGGYNTAVGYEALDNSKLGNNNTGLGYYAGLNNTVGGLNTFIGYQAYPNVGNLINATAIGALAYVTQNNSLILGSILNVNSATASALIGIGTTAPAATFDVEGTAQTLALIGTGASASGNIRFQVTNSSSSTASAQIWNAFPNTGGSGPCTSALCHTALSIKMGNNIGTATQNPGLADRFINFALGNGQIIGKIQGNTSGSVALSSTGGDYAEWFKKANVNDVLNPGDLACSNANGEVVNCDNNNTSLLGVVSDSYFLLGNSSEAVEGDPHYVIIGLVGQIKTYVSSASGAINAGDMLTYSSTPGVAVKATTAGPVIGKALQSGTSGRINAYINPTWYDPDVQLTSTGNLNIIDGTPNIPLDIQHTYTLSDPFGLPIGRVGAFAELAVANLKAGFISAQQISTNALSVATENVTIGGQNIRDYIASVVSDVIQNTKYLIPNTDIISPIAEVDQLHTNIISPIGSDTTIALKFDNNKLSILNGNSASASAVASFDNQGNATFSGQLQSNSLQTGDATISGVLHAGKIIADQIEGLNIKAATVSADYITNVTNVYNSNPFPTFDASPSNYSSGSGAFANLLTSNNFINIATFSSQLAYVDSLSAANAAFSQGLMVFGPTSLSDTSIVGQLSINGNLILADDSINVLGSDLNLQPLRQGGLSIMAGLIRIDTNGNLSVSGNADFAQNVTVKGNLAAGIISPLPGSDLTINLASGSANGANNSKLVINNSGASSVLSVSQQGDIIASGAGTFGKLNLSLIQPAFAVSPTEVIASGSAGTASINAHKTEVTIDNPLVTDKSLIYITPVSSTGNQVLFLQRQVPGESFTVGIENETQNAIPFNWIIVN